MGAANAVEQSVKATNAVFADVVKDFGRALGVMGRHHTLGKLASSLGPLAIVSLSLVDLRYRESLQGF